MRLMNPVARQSYPCSVIFDLGMKRLVGPSGRWIGQANGKYVALTDGTPSSPQYSCIIFAYQHAKIN